MKKETKELVEFIKDCVFRYQTELKRGEVDVGMIDGEKENQTCDKAITFLNSLPEIESHLCNGGYIQDSNEIPCCHGDKVRFKLSHCLAMEKHIKEHGEVSTGTLEWNSHIRAFIIKFDNATWGGDWVCFDAGNDEIEWFEKVV